MPAAGHSFARATLGVTTLAAVAVTNARRPIVAAMMNLPAAQMSAIDAKRTSAGCSATCGSASCHPLTSPFRALMHPQSLYIHPSAHFADVHCGMLFESRSDATFDLFPPRAPPLLF